ncbi:MltA domain-containing protein [Komagataeibacter rhaeticus]|nr:MltA domain-containing protein [Komagataeibacter rhaeticus]
MTCRWATGRRRGHFEQWFRPYTMPAGPRAGGMLFTGYYEPEIRGSLRRGHAPDPGLPPPARSGA